MRHSETFTFHKRAAELVFTAIQTDAHTALRRSFIFFRRTSFVMENLLACVEFNRERKHRVSGRLCLCLRMRSKYSALRTSIFNLLKKKKYGANTMQFRSSRTWLQEFRFSSSEMLAGWPSSFELFSLWFQKIKLKYVLSRYGVWLSTGFRTGYWIYWPLLTHNS
jgi:predicted protein tyrosine phosphatase